MLCHSSVLTWPATTLGSAVATPIMILAAFAEFSYIPTTGTIHPTSPVGYFYSFSLALTAGGPAFCLGELAGRRRIPHFHSRYCPVFFFSTGGPCCLVIMPSVGCLSIGSLASHASTSRIVTFTANYPILRCPACLGSIFLRFLAFSCKFTKSYFSQTTNATSCATSRMSCWR